MAALGPAIAVVLGVSLWAQIALFALRDELAGGAGPLRLLLFLVPFGVLGVGVWLRSNVTLLAVFPLALLPPAAVVAARGQAAALDPWTAAQLCATMALYLALVSNWLGATRGEDRIRREEPTSERARIYRRFVYPRLLPLLLLWAVPTYAIFWDPAIAGTILQNHPENPAIAQIFMAMLVFFAWCVAAYMSFVVPSLNLEYDRRRIDREIQAIGADAEPRAVVRRIGIASAFAIVITFILLLIV